MYRLSQIKDVLAAQWLQKKEDVEITQLQLDSRRIHQAGEALFFALPGTQLDGHQFLLEAYQKGVRAFIVSNPKIDLTDLEEASVLLIEDSVRALQQLATHHRQQFDLEVLGITGSNGKTIIKEWLYQILSPTFKVVRSPRSYNSQIGVPLSIWRIRKEHQLGIFEAGISTINEMENIAAVIQCKTGLFTTLGGAHDEGFADRRQKLREKLGLFKTADTIIYCKDQELVHEAIRQLPQKKLSWSMYADADLQINSILKGELTTAIKAVFQDRALHIQIPFVNDISIQNAIHCWAYLLHIGLDDQLIQEGMSGLENIPMRLEIKAGIGDCTIINDTYNNDLNALDAALKMLKERVQGHSSVLFISDLLQSGMNESLLYQKLAKLLLQYDIQEVVAVGDKIRHLQQMLPTKIKKYYYRDTYSCLRSHPFYKYQKAVILIKGARPFAFEQITNRLTTKTHAAILEVNLNALVYNLKTYQRLLKKDTKIMVMVKAAAYGSGSVEVAQLLAHHKVDYLAVAYVDEGVELRQAGIRIPILVLNPEPQSFATLLRYRLEPEIYSLEQLKELANLLKGEMDSIKVHLNLDTGMHRLGFNAAELPELINYLKTENRFLVKSVFSHLAASDEAEHDAFTHEQYQLFERMSKQIIEGLEKPVLRHLLNSNGISRFPQYQLDMVRLGIGLYGLDTSNSLEQSLRPVLQLMGSISQIKELKAGDRIGYGRRGRLEQDSRIATVNIGYADGLPRSAGEKAYHLRVHAQLAPIVGSVCMDMCMIDVSEIAEAKEGDTVIIFGRNNPIELLSKIESTIPYEILTRISERVKRVYVRE